MKEKYKNIGDVVTRTIEECSELIHILCKVKRFGWDCYHPEDAHMTPNSQLTKMEIKDLRECLKELEGEI